MTDPTDTTEPSSQDDLALDVTSVPLFQRTDALLIVEALAGCVVLEVPAQTPLLRPGAENHSVYIPLSGKVVVHLDAKLNPATSIPIRLGECVGELSAIDGKPVSALVITETAARILEIPQQVFWERLMTLPGVAASFMILLSERLRRSTEHALKAQGEQLELLHLRKELNVARQLQTSMLPLQRPLFPERDDVAVCGFMEPASNVGGDLFDAFFVREHQLFFCIGDVSGHGIASALFMARTIGLLRILAMTTFQPDRLLKKLNDRLCLNNDTNLFVTLFCGFLDVQTGKLVYSNGGHCPPILSSGEQITDLPIPKGPLVGAFPAATYHSMRHDMAPGSTLYCYTDGVTEAQDPSGVEFSEDRCKQTLHEAAQLPLQSILDTVRRQVAAFTGTDVLEDDFTMLAIRRVSPAVIVQR
jgi:sigma-B regulation protein RsbU (phosphoserine phosphatase)